MALISLATMSTSLNPMMAGPRNRTINMAPETHTSVPPTFAWPSILNKFTLSVLEGQIGMFYLKTFININNEGEMRLWVHQLTPSRQLKGT